MTWVGDTLVTLVADFSPKYTALVLDRFTPVMVTVIPPEVGPWFGDMDMMHPSCESLTRFRSNSIS